MKNLAVNDTDIVKFCVSHLNEYISEENPGIKIDSWFVQFLFNKLFEECEEELKVILQ